MTTTVSTVTSLSLADKLRAEIVSAGDVRQFTLSTLVDFLTQELAVSDNKVTQYASPSATGFSVSVTNSSQSTWLRLTPLATYANGTIVLPAVANCIDKQEIIITTTQQISTLTINGNGATVYGGPSTLNAGGHVTLRFDALDDSWTRVN